MNNTVMEGFGDKMHNVYSDVLEKMSSDSIIQKYPDEIESILECALNIVKENSDKEFKKLLLKLHKLVYDCKFSKGLALYAVSHMENKDPKHPKGEFWSMKEIEGIAKQYGLPNNESDLPTTYFLMNMIRSDYFNSKIVENDVEYYAGLAKDWLGDKDIPDAHGKTFNYWYHIVKGY